MTALPYVFAVIAAIVAAAAARRVAAAKGLVASNWAVGTFVLWPVGLLAVAFKEPVDGSDRLAWWSDAPIARTWMKLAAFVGVACVGAVVAVALLQTSPAPTYDGTALDGEIQTWLGQQQVDGATVTCPPTYPGRSGYVFYCDVAGAGAVQHVRVTVDNSAGQVQWEMTQ